MSEHGFTQRGLVEFRLTRDHCLKPELVQIVASFFRSLPDADSRADAYLALIAWRHEMRDTLKARKNARALRRPLVRLAAANPTVERTETAMPRDAFRVILGQATLTPAAALESSPEGSHEPEAA